MNEQEKGFENFGIDNGLNWMRNGKVVKQVLQMGFISPCPVIY